jgi:hypothetical protein
MHLLAVPSCTVLAVQSCRAVCAADNRLVVLQPEPLLNSALTAESNTLPACAEACLQLGSAPATMCHSVTVS